jgi:hypothetical protein
MADGNYGKLFQLERHLPTKWLIFSEIQRQESNGNFVSVVILSAFELSALFRCKVILFDVMEVLPILFHESWRKLFVN